MSMSITPFSIDKEKISNLLELEFENWTHNFGQRPIPEGQDFRAFFVQWFSVFVPECFEQPLVKKILNFANKKRQEPDFYSSKWHELLPIETALYAISSDPLWIKTATINLNHHKSGIRFFVLKSLLLVVDKLSFADTNLLNSVVNNLENWHFGSKDTALFLSMTQGDLQTKQTQFQQWLDCLNLFSGDRECLEMLCSGEIIPNPFLYDVMQIACYVLSRLASKDTSLQLPLFTDEFVENSLTDPDEIQMRSPIEQSDLGSIVWKRMTDHSIFKQFIMLEQV